MTIDMTGYYLENGNDYEQQQQKQTNTIQGTSTNTMAARSPPSKSPLAFPPVAVVSTSVLGPLTTGQLQQQYRHQKLLQRQHQQLQEEEQEDIKESMMEKLDLLQRDRQAHHRAVIMGDSAVHLHGEEGLGSTMSVSPTSSPQRNSPAAVTDDVHHDTLSSALQQLVGNDSVHGGHANEYGSSEDIVSMTAVVSDDDTNNPYQQPLPIKSIANIQSDAPLLTSPSPSSLVSITTSGRNGEGRGGECGPETPGLQQLQHGTSLFDFLRGRKASIPKYSLNHHQAAAAHAVAVSGASLSGPAVGSAGITVTPSSTKPTTAATHPTLFPPPIFKSRMSGVVVASGWTGPPIPPPVRKQSLDTSMLQGNLLRSCGNESPSCSPLYPGMPTGDSFWNSRRGSVFMHNSTYTPQLQHSIAGAAQSTFSKVAAVIGATVGKRRPSMSATNEIEAVVVGLAGSQVDGDSKQQPQQYGRSSIHMKYGPPLDQEQLHYHAQFMNSERELEQTRMRAEEDKQALVGEIDRIREQVVTMEENFLLWRTKVRRDQMAEHEEFLHERLVNQDRIEELAESLSASQEEATRLRNRLLVLEYEDDYIGPSSHFSESDVHTNHSSAEEDDNNSNPSTMVTIDYGPMTVAAHKRRSGDFKILEQKARSFEAQIQGLKKTIEQEREDHQKALVEFRMRLHDKCVRLEHEAQAAKMESTMYTEMMHEIVSENDDLRKQVKEAQRKLRRQGQGSTLSCSKSSDSSIRRTKNCFGYAGYDDSSDSVYGSEDEIHLQQLGENRPSFSSFTLTMPCLVSTSPPLHPSYPSGYPHSRLISPCFLQRTLSMPHTDSPQLSATVVPNHESNGADGNNEDNGSHPDSEGSYEHEDGIGEDQGYIEDDNDDEEAGYISKDEENDDHDDHDNHDDNDDNDDNVDLAYQAALLRIWGLNWMEHPEYASHRLVVLPEPGSSNATSVDGERQYFVMAQFVISASAIFRDVIMNQDVAPEEQEYEGGDNSDSDNDNDESHQRRRLSCLRLVPTTDAAGMSFLPLPWPPRPLPAGVVLPLTVHNPDGAERLPLLRLYLHYPDHFPGLLKAMYDHDLDHWEETCFRPETIGPIAHMVDRLECSLALTRRCLEYYRKIMAEMTEEQLEHESMEALRALYWRAVEAGFLPADP
ncbi:MAG: hypothetical protein J3Q66DRAFT_393588 [Benniella sp.]|nr:MAG: hypothetical protein J3Q66DRAFT_393588 [Benniella sp.]